MIFDALCGYHFQALSSAQALAIHNTTTSCCRTQPFLPEGQETQNENNNELGRCANVIGLGKLPQQISENEHVHSGSTIP